MECRQPSTIRAVSKLHVSPLVKRILLLIKKKKKVENHCHRVVVLKF